MSKLLNISEAFSIAMHSVVLIAESDRMITIQEISNITHASKNHIAKVLQLLAKHSIIKSHRGPAGGFVLAKKPDEIKLMDLYKITDGPMDSYSCEMHTLGCNHIRCVFGGFQEKFVTEFSEYLNSNTVQDLLA